MIWRVEINHKKGVFDSIGADIYKSILDLDIKTVKSVKVSQVYHIEGSISKIDIELICRELLVDAITQSFSLYEYAQFKEKPSAKENHIIEIAHNAGVMDPVEESTVLGIKDLRVKGVVAVRTAKKYALAGVLSDKQCETIVNKVLCNKIIQHVVNHSKKPDTFVISASEASFDVILVDLLSADDKQLKQISSRGQLFLNLNEMKEIKKYFKKAGRNPTDCELETIAQTWSEHCYHKTFRGNIRYTYKDNGKFKSKTINNLLKSTIIKATKEINKSWCVSVFHDNAGVIAFDEESHVCFKAETHNHPSALEPFGGANTGIGGVIRDILGTGLGAKPILNTDVFCFAPPDMKFSELPAGTLHPKRIMKGVVGGVRDYGNKMGIPTINGSILFDRRFVGNPLVYCGSVGIMPKDKVKKEVFQGDLVIALGGKTGRDGIHGATFSSGELTTKSEVVSSGAVQIGDPIQEKKVLDALLKARDLNLYTSITDCGAGGFSSAVGEMGKDLGVRVDLDKAPLKYNGLTYTEIWISESQERMVVSVSPKDLEKFLKVFEEENVEASVIGEFTGSKRLELFYKNCQVCDLDIDFLHEGTPKITKEALWEPPKLTKPRVAKPDDLNEKLCDVLSHYNVCSKEWVIRQYDHEVQGASVIKPLVGINCDGPSDASVVAPKLGSYKGIAVSNGINIRFGMIDPYWMAASCIDEAIRQIISVGGALDKIAILDNFCWGNPDKPDRLGSLVRAAQGCYAASVAYQVPFISGKDSLYNEYTDGEKSIAIPGTLLISAIGIVDDVRKTVTMDFKEKNNLIYVIGETLDEMGGSIYLDTFGLLGNTVPNVNFKKAVKLFKALTNAVHKGLVRSIHDCSEGGLAVALAEMAFSGGLGATIRLDKLPKEKSILRDDTLLFSESNSRFVVEVEPQKREEFERQLAGVVYGNIGTVEGSPEFIVYGVKKNVCINLNINDLKETWQEPLRW